mmetsp:Transcript_17130/g.38235  ORF Transcript_17130/g.38235 Transcript_17130/m.38235 type:complete len:205 (+) Transcript_17130:291-905(+)
MLFQFAHHPELQRTVLADVLLRGVLPLDVVREVREQPVRRRTVLTGVRLACVIPSDVHVEVPAPPERRRTVHADVRLRGVLPSDVLFEVVEQRERSSEPVPVPTVLTAVRPLLPVDRRAVPLELLGTREPPLTRRADVPPLALVDRRDVHLEVGRALLQTQPRLQDPATSCRSALQLGASHQRSNQVVKALATRNEEQQEQQGA